MCPLRPGASQTTCFKIFMCPEASQSTWYASFSMLGRTPNLLSTRESLPQAFFNVWARSLLHFPCLGVPQAFFINMRTHTPDFFYVWARWFCSIASGHTQDYLSPCERIPQAFFYAWARLFHQSHTACTRSLLINTQWKGKGGRRVRRPTKKKTLNPKRE